MVCTLLLQAECEGPTFISYTCLSTAHLDFLVDYFSEIIIGVDRNSREETFWIANKYSKNTFYIDNPSGIIEGCIEQLVSHCSNDWILRLDDDELISIQLIEFMKNYLSSLSVDAVGIHRKWCRINLDTCCLEYSTNPIYGLDWQWRLFRKCRVGFNTKVHTPGITFNTEIKAPLDGFIIHLDWVYHDFKNRNNKITHYESMCNGLSHSEYYYFEQDASNDFFFMPLFLNDFNKITPFLSLRQKKTNHKTNLFFFTDLTQLNIVLKSTIKILYPGTTEHIKIPVQLTNNTKYGLNPHLVKYSYHWINATNNDCVIFDGIRTVFTKIIFPGESQEQFIDVITPDNPGLYNLLITLVKENAFWFEQHNPAISLIIPCKVIFRDVIIDLDEIKTISPL